MLSEQASRPHHQTNARTAFHPSRKCWFVPGSKYLAPTGSWDNLTLCSQAKTSAFF